MEKDILHKLIEKYLEGDCTPEEVAVIYEWYNSFEDEQDPADFISSQQQQELKKRLLANIKINIRSREANESKSVSRTMIYMLSGVAAIVILTIGVFFFNQKASDHLASGELNVVNMTKNIQRLVLSDGTIAWLNPKSRLIYPQNFTVSQRKVKMQGEVFFEVTPDRKRPFIIYSGDVITRVWGTSFRIRAYKNIPVDLVGTGGMASQYYPADFDFLTKIPNKIKILDKKPLNGGTPAIEKKIKTKEKAQALFILKKFDKLTKNKDLFKVLLKRFTFV